MSMPFTATRDIIVRTPEFEGARHFYGAVLGLPVAFQGEALTGYDAGAFRLYVEPGAAHGPVFEFLVPDFDVARALLLESGCQILEEDAGVPRCYLRDPFGLCFNIAARPA